MLHRRGEYFETPDRTDRWPWMRTAPRQDRSPPRAPTREERSRSPTGTTRNEEACGHNGTTPRSSTVAPRPPCRDPNRPAAAQATPTRPDPLNIGGWPGEASQGQFRLLWLELFELITAGQGDDMQNAEMVGIPVHAQAWRLAPWLEGRIEALADRLTPQQTAVAMAGLHDCMAYVSAIATSMLLQSMEEMDRGEECSEQPEPATEDEEVEIEEPGAGETEDATALMQMVQAERDRPTPKEESWRPLTKPEKRRIAKLVRTLLAFQDEAEPSLTVLAFVDDPPAMCGESNGPEQDPDLQVSIGELRPALVRWLWATPRQYVPAAIEVLFAVPGRTYQNQAAAQATARQLQSEVETLNNPLLDQLLRSWSDSSDAGLVEEALRIAKQSPCRTTSGKTTV